MADKETFILVSLEESKAKELAQLITNNTCRTILEYLSNKEEATESQIAKDLNLPISTVHYNLQHLLKHNLIESKEFMWSPKGKQMDIYKIAKKLILIVPKGTGSTELKSMLKGLIPVALISVAAAGFMHFLSKGFGVSRLASESRGVAKEAMLEAAPRVAYQSVVQQTAPYWLWFMGGALFAVLLFVLYLLIRYWKRRL